MASERALAIRRAAVENKLMGLAERVNSLSAAPAPPPAYAKAAEIAALERLEWVTRLLDAQIAQMEAIAQQLAETTAVAADLEAQLAALAPPKKPE